MKFSWKMEFHKCFCFVPMFLMAHFSCNKILGLCLIQKCFKKQRRASLVEVVVINKEAQESDNLPNSTFTECKSIIAEQNVLNREVEKSVNLQETTFPEEIIQHSDISCHVTINPKQNELNKKEDISVGSNSTIPKTKLLNREINNETSVGQQQVIERENTIHKQSVVKTQQANIPYNLSFKLQFNTEESEKLQPFPIQKVHLNNQLIRDLANAFNVNYPVDKFLKKPYTLTKLIKTSDEYQKVHKLFSKGNSLYFDVKFIFKINNIFLHLHYLLLKAKYKWYYNNIDVGESVMYHGTKQEFLPGICCWNFDKAKVKTHKYGKGISFAKQPFYATFYHQDNKGNLNKVMIMAHVLNDVGPSCIGNPSMVIPPEPSFTSTNENQSVTVKYQDASFYPNYLILYKGLHPQYRCIRKNRKLIK